MALGLASLPVAAGAGVVGILSPCVWPLVPVVISSAASSGRAGPWFLTAGLSLSFALAGTVLSFLLVSTGLDPELFRLVSAGMLLFVAAALLNQRLGLKLNQVLSGFTNRLQPSGQSQSSSAAGQFGVGLLLGLIWLPCVGPSLGAAIALASAGQQMGLAFLTMLAYGIGTGGVLLVAGLASRQALLRMRPQILSGAGRAKKLLGWTLLLLGLLVLTGWDKVLEAAAAGWLPDWLFAW